jgi:hypothetical protein
LQQSAAVRQVACSSGTQTAELADENVDEVEVLMSELVNDVVDELRSELIELSIEALLLKPETMDE